MEHTSQPVYGIVLFVRIQYYTETVIQIFKTYIVTRTRCYIGIISRILSDSYRMNKSKYGLHVLTEPLYDNKRGSSGKFCSTVTRILSEYGRIRCKKTQYSFNIKQKNGLEYLFYYIPQALNKKLVNTNKQQNIPVTTKLSSKK